MRDASQRQNYAIIDFMIIELLFCIVYVQIFFFLMSQNNSYAIFQ